MTTLTITEAKENFSYLISQVVDTGERVVLIKNKKKAAAVISIEDLELLEIIEDQLDVEAAKTILAKMKADGEIPIPWESIKAEAGL